MDTSLSQTGSSTIFDVRALYHIKDIQSISTVMKSHLQTQTPASGQILGLHRNHQNKIRSTKHWILRELASGYWYHSTCSSVEKMDVVHSEFEGNHGCTHSQASWRWMLSVPSTWFKLLINSLEMRNEYDVAKIEWRSARTFSSRNFHLTVKYEHYIQKKSSLNENIVKLTN
jgi:hypothetical protein